MKLYETIAGIVLFLTIMAIIVKNDVFKSLLYYILWLTIIFTLLANYRTITDLINPVFNIGKV